MSTPMPRPCLLMTLLDERYYEEAPDHSVVCLLWRMRPKSSDGGFVCYAVGMESPTRRYLYRIGEDESAARRLFESIVEGRLSPVHLGEVVEDFLWEEGQRSRAVADSDLPVAESLP